MSRKSDLDALNGFDVFLLWFVIVGTLFLIEFVLVPLF